MNWTEVVRHLKIGNKVRRPHWNRDLYIYHDNPHVYFSENGYYMMIGDYEAQDWVVYKPILHLKDIKVGQKFKLENWQHLPVMTRIINPHDDKSFYYVQDNKLNRTTLCDLSHVVLVKD